MADEPRWLAAARKDIGLAEIPGKNTAPTIARWLRELKAWWSDDETPWCGVAVAAWMRAAGIPLPKHWYRARAWAEWGVPLTKPILGAVVVYARGGAGHVGLVVGIDQRGRILTIAGNQGNRVSIAPFDSGRVLSYRWPSGEPRTSIPAPVLVSTGDSSSNEA